MLDLNRVDMCFSEVAVFNLALIDKFSLSNTFSRPNFKSVTVFVVLKNLENFDSPRLLASVFLLRLMTRQKPYIARFGLFQTFKERDYDILVRVALVSRKGVYNFLGLLAFNVAPFIAKSDYRVSYAFVESCVVVFIAISDLSFIRFIETHSAFFRWREILQIRVLLSSSSRAQVETFLSFLKIV